MFDVDASSPAIVNVSPEQKYQYLLHQLLVNVSPKSTALVVPLSASIEIVAFASLPFAIEPPNCAFVIVPESSEVASAPKDKVPEPFVLEHEY